jgi:glyoxylase-like metal-dependent hydrolase (beta-lactamase superfamily II)
MARWKIYALLTGTSPVDKSVVTYLQEPGTPFRVANVIFVLEGAGEHIVVDTSFESVEAIRRINKRELERTPAQEPAHQLAQIGVDPLKVRKVVHTHLHYDHVGNNRLFPNARFYVQREELRFAFAPNPLLAPIYHSPLLGHTPGYLGSSLEILDGDMPIAAGVTVIHVPGHTPGSQAVLVETEAGVYCIAGDTIPLFENIEKGIPHGVHDSVSDWYRSLNRIKALADYVIPSHDMRLFEQGPIVVWPGAYAYRIER